METTFCGPNVVSIGTDIFRVCGIELKGDFYLGVFPNSLYVNGLRMQNLFVLVLVGDKGGNAAIILKGHRF